MGGCAGCVGPNRRASQYKVSRLTEDAAIKQSVSASELPIRRHKDKVLEQLHQSKKRMDHNNNLISPLLNSLGLHDSPNTNSRHNRMTTSAIYQRQNQEENNRLRGVTTSSFNVGLKRSQSRFPDENYHKKQDSLLTFEKPMVESKILHHSNHHSNHSFSPQKTLHTSEFKSHLPPLPKQTYKSSFHGYKEPVIRSNSFSREPFKMNYEQPSHQVTFKEPLTEVLTNTKLGDLQRSTHLKSNKLLNIPELPEQQSRTPLYVTELRKQNGQDVKKSGLTGLPRKLESVTAFALHRYLKDLQ